MDIGIEGNPDIGYCPTAQKPKSCIMGQQAGTRGGCRRFLLRTPLGTEPLAPPPLPEEDPVDPQGARRAAADPVPAFDFDWDYR